MFATLLAVVVGAAPASQPCAYDRQRLLALDQKAFDQDLKGGWRVLAENPRCYAAAADLIRDYREAHHLINSILFWHEGQMRAEAGQSKAAIELFEKSRHKEPDRTGWNLYVDGSVAFLRHDRSALKAARDKLGSLPKPADWPPAGPDGKPFNIPWPPNLNILEGFLTCFNQTYEKAYGSNACSQPMIRIAVPHR